jgi:hypothetical protein
MRPDHRPQAHVIVQTSKPDKFPHIFLISASRFQVRDVRQPFFFRRNIGELLELGTRQGLFGDLNLYDSSTKAPASLPQYHRLRMSTIVDQLLRSTPLSAMSAVLISHRCENQISCFFPICTRSISWVSRSHIDHKSSGRKGSYGRRSAMRFTQSRRRMNVDRASIGNH